MLLAVALVACSSDKKPASSSASSSASPSTATTLVTTTAPPTTVSPLSAIEGCPDPGPLAVPDRHRPVYTATAAVDVAGSTVTGSVTVVFTPDLPTNELVFRLWPNAPVLAASGVHEEVGGVMRGGVALAVDQPDPTTVHVALPAKLNPGESTTVTVPYSLTIPGGNADRVAHQGDTMRLGSFLPLLAWEPGVGWATDPPTTAHAEAATSPAADYDVAITVPDGYDVLGSGERSSDNHWRAKGVRDIAYSIGHFTVAEADVGGVHVSLGVDQSVGEDPARYLNLITDSLGNYQARLGAYPWPTYTAAVMPGFSGGIEFPTHVMHGAGSTTRSIVHEVAHQWFYALIGNDQGRDPWLDEGLASYVEYVQVASLSSRKAQPIPSDAVGRAGEPMSFWDHHEPSYFEGVYVQGAVAVARLGSVDQVDCALRQYVAHNAFRIATPADLFSALAGVFPDAVDRLAPYGLHP
ncbi:MAG: hypothetical protein QOI95_2361 [Acidimicrobiaceae bacterium]